MKRILSILLCTLIMISSCQFMALAEDTASAAAPAEAGFISYLGIMTPGNSADYWSAKVTRADAARYVYTIAKSESGTQRYTYYTDVPKGSELETAVSHLVNVGVLSIGDNRLFRPDDLVTYSELCKMLVTLAGYDAYAKAIGGYPGGYITTAHKLDITDGVTASDDVSNYDMAVMLYNTLHAGMFDVDSITENGPVYTDKDTETVMERFFDIYTAEGVVTKQNSINLNSSERCDEDIIEVGGTEYMDLTDGEAVLGYDVKAFVKDTDGAKDTVVYTEISDRNSIVVIDAEDLIEISINEVKYHDDKDKTETAKLSDAAFVKNGSVIGFDIPEKANIDKGTITLISNSGKSSYSTVLITEYEIFVVGLLDSTNKRIYDKFNPKMMVCLDDDKLTSAQVIMNGKNANFMHIAENDVLSVVRSEDGEYVKAVIATDIVKGKIDSVESGSDNIITVDGTEYKLDSALADRISAGTAVLGDTSELVLDITGEVAYIRASQNEAYKIGYVCEGGINGGGLKSQGALAICTIDGQYQIYNLDEKISINDGKRESDAKAVFKTLAKAGSDTEIEPQLIRFALNNDGEIYAVNTADYSDNMAKSRYISRILDEGNYTYRSNLIYPITAMNVNTVTLQVPYDNVIANKDDYDRYFKVVPKNTFKGSNTYTFEAYKINDDTPYADVVLYKCDKPTEDSNHDSIGIVRRVSRTMDGYGEDTFAIEMFERGKGVKHITSTDCIWKDNDGNDITPGSLKEGDCVRYSFNGYGSIAYIKHLFRPSDHTDGDVLAGMVGSYDQRVRLTYHYAADKYEGNEMESGGITSLLSFSTVFGGDVELRLPYSRLEQAVIYDSTRREGDRVYLGNIDNIITYKGTDGADASVIITHAYIGEIRNVYVIN